MKNTNKKGIHLSTLTIFSIGITVTAAVAVSAAAFITVYSNALLRNAATSSEQAVLQTANIVSTYLGKLEKNLDLICDEIEVCSDIDEVKERITTTSRLQDDIEAILVYSQSGEVLAASTDKGELKENIYRDLSFDAQRFQNGKKYAVSPPHVETLFSRYYPWVVTIAKKESIKLFGSDVYVALDFSFSSIADYVDNVGIGKHGYCYIIDENGSIVYHPQQQMIFSGLKDEKLDEVTPLGDGAHFGKDVIYTLTSLKDSTWRIVGTSYTDDINQSRTQTILRVISVSFFCCLLIALIIVLLFSRIITRPVRELVKAMKDFESDAESYKYKNPTGNVAELQTLSDSFDHMVSMIKELMDKVRMEEITLRKTELRALQAQINPHFLYNTLDSIQWMCEQEKTEDAVKMVGALAKLFRISISRGKELITIQDELRHAHSYLVIQSYRYKNKFEYKFDVDQDVLDCLCCKITIQPLIENAIYHGIENMVDEGLITVSVKSDGNDILISVSDNGVGMTKEQCDGILKKEKSDSSGIGIKNVNDRIRITFGEGYGISIESELDVGTTVAVRLPKKREE